MYYCLLDEIQNVNGWHLFVNRMLRSGLKVILTGIFASEISFNRIKNIFGLGSKFSPDHGRILENIVFLKLARDASENHYELFYYKKQVEVDFVIFSNQKVIELIQVSRSLADSKTYKREIRSLMVAADELKVRKLTIITLAERNILKEEGKEIRVIPITEWLLRRQALAT